jgi:WhiB family redox-sensing transcriptional regulator
MTGYIAHLTSPALPNAACVGKDPEQFYADDCQIPDKAVVEQARTICISCVERVACLMWAMQNEKHGMWGAFTANERRYFRQRKLHKLKHLIELDLL